MQFYLNCTLRQNRKRWFGRFSFFYKVVRNISRQSFYKNPRQTKRQIAIFARLSSYISIKHSFNWRAIERVINVLNFLCITMRVRKINTKGLRGHKASYHSCFLPLSYLQLDTYSLRKRSNVLTIFLLNQLNRIEQNKSSQGAETNEQWVSAWVFCNKVYFLQQKTMFLVFIYILNLEVWLVKKMGFLCFFFKFLIYFRNDIVWPTGSPLQL